MTVLGAMRLTDGSSPVMDDEAMRATVMRLSRPHPSGGRVIERAAVVAAGPGAAKILTWVAEHGEAESLAPPAAAQGLHGTRGATPGSDQRRPLRYVLPAEVLSRRP